MRVTLGIITFLAAFYLATFLFSFFEVEFNAFW